VFLVLGELKKILSGFWCNSSKNNFEVGDLGIGKVDRPRFGLAIGVAGG
jgi:hypothetical protein